LLPGIQLSVTDMRPELGIARSTIYDRSAATAHNPFVQLGGDR
jgi:hypothetical protein